jgi:CheY-like chemotaxis protein
MRSERIVIIADDDEDIRESLASVLREEGYETRCAEDGREALLVLDSLAGAPCVIILDLMMPVMNGFDVLDALAKDHRLSEVPVIVCSAALPLRPLPVGIRRFVPKPVSLEVLLVGLDALCKDESRPSLEVSKPETSKPEASKHALSTEPLAERDLREQTTQLIRQGKRPTRPAVATFPTWRTRRS